MGPWQHSSTTTRAGNTSSTSSQQTSAKELSSQVCYSPILQHSRNLVSTDNSWRAKRKGNSLRTNHLAEQAVSTSMVYLFRSMGSVWGVAAAATIIQNVLSSRLPSALSGIPDKLKVILFFCLQSFPSHYPLLSNQNSRSNKRKRWLT
jgi:hypothetical protein